MDTEEYLKRVMVGITEYRDTIRSIPSSEESSFIDFCMANLHKSRSQLLQDLFVLFQTHQSPNRFFVEFGATNGVDLSNTWLLEKQYGWQGILAEPALGWHAALDQNRRCAVDKRCVWRTSGETIVFNETNEPEFSTVNAFSDKDRHAERRASGNKYEVPSIALLDLLIEHQAPKVIDYLSIDTEGSELEILSAFDFTRYDIRLITVEHNFSDDRSKIHDLLRQNKFRRTFENLSRWDDWYVRT